MSTTRSAAVRATGRVLVALACALLAGVAAAAGEMQPLQDSEMSDITGQQGIVFAIKLRNNVDASYNPIGCTVNTLPAPNGTPNPCRIGLQFVARLTVWLMFKEFYGTLEYNNLRMDASYLPAASTGFQNTTRFQDPTGAFLVPLGNPNGLQALLFTFPATLGASASPARAAGIYDDLRSFLNIGRIAIEQNGVGPAVEGYMRDTSTNAVVALRMSDSGAPNSPAYMRIDGNGYVYGF